MAVTFKIVGDALHFVYDGVTYQFTDAGLHTVPEMGVEAAKVVGPKATEVANQALIEIEKDGKALSKEVKAQLPKFVRSCAHDNLVHVEGPVKDVFTARLTKVRRAIASVGKLQHGVAKDEAETLLKSSPLVRDLLTERAEANIKTVGLEISVIEKELAAAASRTSKLKALNAELKMLLKGNNKQAVTDFIKKNVAFLEELNPSAELVTRFKDATSRLFGAVGGFDFSVAKESVLSEVNAAVARIEPLALELVEKHAFIKAGPGEDALKVAKDRVAVIEKEITVAMKGDYAELIKAKVHARVGKEVLGDVLKISPQIGASLGAAAESTAKESRGFWKKAFEFKRSEALIAEQAEKAGITDAAKIVEKFGKAGEIRWGARVVPAAAVLAGVAWLGSKMLGSNDNQRDGFAAREEARRMAAAQAQGAARA